MSRSLLLLLLVHCTCVLASCNRHCGEMETEEVATTTLYLVRHAEKGFGFDPDLTEEGRKRAQRLSQLAALEGLAAVYSTDTRRTRQTAAATAARYNLRVRTYDARNLTAFARNLRDGRFAGRTVLVVGHSNTTPELANLIVNGAALDRFREDDFGNLLRVQVDEAGTGTVTKLRY